MCKCTSVHQQNKTIDFDETTLATGHSKDTSCLYPIFENIIYYKEAKDRNTQTENSPNDPQYQQASMQVVFQNQFAFARIHFESHQIPYFILLVAFSASSLVHGQGLAGLVGPSQLDAFVAAVYHP